MKRVIIIILILLVGGLGYACWTSISSEISFNEEKASREEAVKDRLLQIRDIEESYKRIYGEYCGSWDELIAYVKEGKVIEKTAQSGGVKDEDSKEEIQSDTIWFEDGAPGSVARKFEVSNPDSLCFIPVGNHAKMLLYADSVTIESKVGEEVDWETVKVMEVRAAFNDYMDGLPEKKLTNILNELKNNYKGLINYETEEQDDDWFGLRVGDKNDGNNRNAGNWD